MFENLNSLIDSLSYDHRRGAAEIVDDSAELLRQIAYHGVKNPTGAEQLFGRAVRQLAQNQATMAPVLNMLNDVCLAKEAAGDDWESLSTSLEGVMSARQGKLEAMIGRCDELPRVDGTLMTFSNSSTVARLIAACHKSGWPKRVICSESRPVMEGLVMARKLTAAGVPVTVFTDSALMSRVREAGAIWVGGDSLSSKGLVNKVGSYALAMLAKMRGIPFVSLMSTEKLLSLELLPFFKFIPQNPREVAPDDADDLDVVNEYYENIPLDVVSYVFSEQGLFKPDELIERTVLRPLSPLFRKLASS